MGERRPDVIVVGAGVIGLTMGVCLAELGLRVQIRTRVASSATTSAVASAMVGPSFAPADDPVGVRERVGIEEFTQLAAVEGTGVALRRGRLVSRLAGPLPPGVQLCAPGELPRGFAAGFWARLPLVDMPVYLDYLVRRLTAAGGQIELAQVGSLAELAEQAPLLANCAGLGARELVPDPSVRAVRGQQVIVDNPGLDEFFISAPFEPAWTAYWPYHDHVVLGGTQDEDEEDLDPLPPSPRRSCAAASTSNHGCGTRGCADTRWDYDPAGRACGWKLTRSATPGVCTTTGMVAAGSPCPGVAHARQPHCSSTRSRDEPK